MQNTTTHGEDGIQVELDGNVTRMLVSFQEEKGQIEWTGLGFLQK